MSGIVNIAGVNPIDDPDYRYKMPRLMAKVEGRGNGVKTVVVNMKEIADALHREPGEVTKFFGTELGAQTTWKDETEKSIVNGNHTAQTLQSQLARYIQAFVLCPGCSLPETLYKLKAGAIYQKCDACGAKNMVDMEHKLTTYILNAYKKSKKEQKAKDDKKDKKKKKDKDGKEGSKDGKEKKSKKDKKSKSKSGDSPVESENGHGSADEDGHSGEEKYLEDDDDDDIATADNVNIDDAHALETAIERFKQFMSSNTDATTADLISELRLAGTLYGLPPEDRIFLFVGAAFGPDCVKQNSVEKHRAVLNELILSIDRVGYQRHTISVMEHLCAVRYPELTKYFPVILKHMFDEELVEEEVFDQWFEGPLQSEYTRRDLSPEQLGALRMAAGTFMTWLKEAEEEDEDDDEDDDEEEEDEDEEA